MAKVTQKTYKDVLKRWLRQDRKPLVADAAKALEAGRGIEALYPVDLVDLFAVEDPTTRADLEANWKQIKQIVIRDQRREVIKNLMTAMERSRGIDPVDPAFWSAFRAGRQPYMKQQVVAEAQRIEAEYPLGVILEPDFQQLRQELLEPEITEETVRAAFAQAGLRVLPDVREPSGTVPEMVRSAWKSAAQYPEFPTLLSLVLFHRRETFTDASFLDGVPSASGTPFGVEDLGRSKTAALRATGTDAVEAGKKVINALVTKVTTLEHLRDVLQITVTESVLEARRRAQTFRAIQERLVKAGLSSDEAARLVEAARRQGSTPVASGPTAADVEQLLAEGRLGEARQRFAAVDKEGDAEPDARRVEQKLASAEAAQKRLLKEYRDALAAGDVDTAHLRLSAAARQDVDDGHVAALLASLPPAAPRALEALVTPDGSVALSWQAAASEGLTFTVVRNPHGPVTGPASGDRIAEGLTTLSSIDSAPLVGVETGYGVYAVKPSGETSAVATVQAVYLPAPQDVTCATGTTTISVRWRRPREATGTRVTVLDAQGATVADEVVSSATSFDAHGLTQGQTYTVHLCNLYVVGGSRRESGSVQERLTPRAEAQPVIDLRTERTDRGVEAIWTSPEGYETQLWASATTFDPEGGESMSEKELAGVARPVRASVHRSADGTTRVSVSELRGLCRLIPVTILDEGVRLGTPVAHGAIGPVTKATATAFTGEVRLAWAWPQTENLRIRVRWSQGGTPRQQMVTPSRYRSQGGFRISGAAEVSDIVLESVATVDGDELVSEPVSVQLPHERQEKQRLEYDLAIGGSGLFGSRERRCRVTVRGGTPGSTARLTAVLSRQDIKPSRPEDARHVSDLSVTFDDHARAEAEFSLGKEKPGFWVRLFPLDPTVVLFDPLDSSTMKG